MTTIDDSKTGRRLKLLVGLVVFAASVAAIASVAQIIVTGRRPDIGLLATLTFLAAVGISVRVHIRIRTSTHAISWAETAIILGLAVAPAPWMVLCTGLGVAISMAIARITPMRAAFGIAKAMMLTAAGGLVLSAFHWHWNHGLSWGQLAPLAAAFVTVLALDEAVAVPVIGLATGTKLRTMYRRDLDIRMGSNAIRFVLVLCTLQLLSVGNGLLIAIPPTILSLHLAYSRRFHNRTERLDWEQLARTTEQLNAVDLQAVLETAVGNARDLFSADAVDVHVTTRGKHYLVRSDESGIAFTARPSDERRDDTAWPGQAVVAPLEGGGEGEHLGELRLLFRGKIKLTEAEHYKLQTFGSALSTAIRNASAYAELARLAAQHEHDAAHDALTDLANRRQLMDKGNQHLTRQHVEGVTALLLIDLNHFKEVNDTLGHAAGDRVLIQIAQRLRDNVHDTDLVARLGGDEFAILFTGLPAPAVAKHRAETLIRALHEPLDIDDMRISIEASGGIAAAPSSGGMPELLRRADVAMYQAKRSGQRVATYTRARDTADVGRLALGGDLSRAMAEHEFTVNFQPIVDLGTGEVIAAEALARWHHPEQGTIDPLRFLETVERSGLLPVFAEAVLDQSLLAAGTWREAGFDLPVAVNVSPRSLLDARFPGSVMARLRAHDLPPDRLILELTETLTISQLEVVDQVLGRLRDEGVRLALDDFGTGYSSLSVLSRIPVHELKIDREFVMAMETSAEAAAVIRSTVDLGHSLDLVVVAEGVESEPQRRALWELGCVAGQGHLFARPMAAAGLLASLHRGSGGRPGTLAPPLHEQGAVIRLSPHRRQAAARPRPERLPHLHP